jgi:hypothetical protein
MGVSAVSFCLSDHGDCGPPPYFSAFVKNKGQTVNRPLGGACATLGWPLRGPWVAQGWPNPRPNPSQQRVVAVFIYPITKLPIYPIMLEYRRNPANSCLFHFSEIF